MSVAGKLYLKIAAMFMIILIKFFIRGFRIVIFPITWYMRFSSVTRLLSANCHVIKLNLSEFL